jgi:hypothetical protein
MTVIATPDRRTRKSRSKANTQHDLELGRRLWHARANFPLHWEAAYGSVGTLPVMSLCYTILFKQIHLKKACSFPKNMSAIWPDK